MGSSAKSKSFNPPGTRIDQLLLEVAFWVLLTQLVGTALYFTGIFSNPQTHKEFIAQFGSMVALGLWFLAQSVRGRIRIRISAYYLPVLLLLVWSAVRTFTSVTPLSYRKWILVAQVAVALPVWVDLLESRRRRVFLSWAIVLIGCVMAAGALIESFGYYPHPLTSNYHRQSIGSFVGHNNPMAAYLLMASIHAIGLLTRFRDRSWSKIFWGILLINFYLIVLSGSRGCWISLPFAGVILFLSFRGLPFARWFSSATRQSSEEKTSSSPAPLWTGPSRRVSLGIVLSVVAGLCLVLVAIGVQDRMVRDSATPTVLDRIRDLGHAFSGTYPRVWGMSLLMLTRHPILGVGFGAWAQQYASHQGDWFTIHPDTRLGLPGITQHTERGHSDYLQTTAELGLIGLFALLWLLAVHGREAFRFLTAARRSVGAVVGLTAMTGTLAHAFVYFPFHTADASCPFLANWALFISARGRRDRLFERSGSTVRWITALAGVFFLLIATHPVGKLVTADVLMSQAWYPLPAGEKSTYGWKRKAGATHWENLAGQFEAAGDVNSAILALREAKRAAEMSLALDPYYPETARLYGSICFRLAADVHRAEGKTDQYPAAIEALERSLRTYVWHGTYHSIAKCATILWKTTGDESFFKKAVESLLAGLRIYPLNYEGLADIGKLYHDYGDDDATMAVYSTTQIRFAAMPEKFADLLYARGGAAWTAGRIEDANFYLSVASVVDEEDSEKRYTLGLFYLSQNRPDALVHVLKQHFRIQPDDMSLPARLFDTWILHGGASPAQAAAVELFTAIDRGPAFRNQLRMVLASFLLHGEYAKADEILAQIPVENAPELAKDRALTQWLKGDVPAAMAGWEQWLNGHQDDADSLVGIGACLKVLFGPSCD